MTHKPKADPRIQAASTVVAEGMVELFNALIAGGYRTHPEQIKQLQSRLLDRDCSVSASMTFTVDGFQRFLFYEMRKGHEPVLLFDMCPVESSTSKAKLVH